MNTARTALAAFTVVAALCCAGCNSTPSASQPAPRARSATTSAATSGALVHSRLAPRQVGTVPTGLHCRMAGDSPATYRPDATCTPGAVDDAVTQANISATICRSGYTTTVRPPTSATDKIKRAMYSAYGVADGTPSELDHLVSLELGGSNDTANLWPEPGSLPNVKDGVEAALHTAVCAHKVTLAAAQQAIASDWATAENSLGIK